MSTMEQMVYAAREALFTLDVENTSSEVLAETAIRAALPILGKDLYEVLSCASDDVKAIYADQFEKSHVDLAADTLMSAARAARSHLSEIMEGR